jgi:hypothetical protein
MTKEEKFLEHITYSTKEDTMQIWFDNQLLSDISFEGVEHLLEDYERCSALAEEVALQSLEYERYEQNNKLYSEEDIRND